MSLSAVSSASYAILVGSGSAIATVELRTYKRGRA